MQRIALCCSALQCAVMCGSELCSVLQYVAVHYCALQWFEVRCSVLQCVLQRAVWCILQCGAVCCIVLHCVLQCVALFCSVLQCVALLPIEGTMWNPFL